MAFKTFAFAGGLLAATISAAAAGPVSGSFTFDIYNNVASTPGSASDLREQAVLTNPLISSANLLQAGVAYTGPISFAKSGGTATIGAFLATSGGTFTTLSSATSAATLSTGNFETTTILVINGTAAAPLNGAITHDDGVSVYQGGAEVTPAGSAAPTSAVPTDFSLVAGAYTIVYVEANGLPADLTFTSTPVAAPEPASLAVLGAGLLGLGGFARRRRG